MLRQMMEAGRVTCEGGLYKLAGFPQQIVEDSKRWVGEEVWCYQSQGGLDKDRPAMIVSVK